MDANEFLETVQQRAGLASMDDAREITDATLALLGAHIAEGEAEDIAAHLPTELGTPLVSESDDEPEEFSVDDFVERVRERAPIEDGETKQYIRAVTSTLADAVDNRELEDARSQLPNEFDSLFEPVETSEESG